MVAPSCDPMCTEGCNPVVLKAATLWLAGATREASRRSPRLRASPSNSLPSFRALAGRSDPLLARALRGPAPPLHLRPLATPEIGRCRRVPAAAVPVPLATYKPESLIVWFVYSPP